MSQGQGRGTAVKERYIGACLRQSLRISMCDLARQYVHIDLNSGCGRNDDAGCLGSPAVFARIAMGMGRPARLVCCDVDAGATVMLHQELEGLAWPGEWPAWAVHCEDNADLLPRLGRELHGGHFGTVVCDPNGPKRGYPREELVEFAAEHPQMDLVLTFNANFYRSIDPARKRKAVRTVENQLRGCSERYGTVRDNIEAFPRENWWISNETNRGRPGNSYVVALGRSMRVRERPCEGFFCIDSIAGRSIIGSLNSYVGQLEFNFSK